MKKIQALSELLLNAVEFLRDKPEQLSLFVDKGKVGAIAAASLSFEYRYTATIVIQDFVGDQDSIFIPILAWIAANQPELLRRQDAEPFAFEVEILDAKSCDVEIAIELTERVIVRQVDGGWQVDHLDDAPIDNTFAGLNPNPWSLIVTDLRAGTQLILPE